MSPFGLLSLFRFTRRKSAAGREVRPRLEVLEDRPVMSAALPTGIYDIPTGDPAPRSMTVGPDGNVWICEYVGDAIARMTPSGVLTQFALPQPDSLPHDITVGPDGNLWFSEPGVNKIGVMNTNGVVLNQYTLTSTPAANIECLDVDSNGNFWFSEYCGKQDRQTRPLHRRLHRVRRPHAGRRPGRPGHRLGNDVWFTEYNTDKIGRLDATTGADRRVPHPNPRSQPWDMTEAPDGNLWFTEVTGDKIGRIDPSGLITEFATSDPDAGPWAITVGPDNNIWFSENGSNQVERMNLSGIVTGVFDVPTPDSFPFAMISGPGDQIWMTENATNKIAMISTDGGVTEIRHSLHGGDAARAGRDRRRRQPVVHRAVRRRDRPGGAGRHANRLRPAEPQQPADRHRPRPGRRRLVHRVGGGQDRHDHAGRRRSRNSPCPPAPTRRTSRRGRLPIHRISPSPNPPTPTSKTALLDTSGSRRRGPASASATSLPTAPLRSTAASVVTLHGIAAIEGSADLFFTAPADNEIWEMDTAPLPVVPSSK